MTGMIVLLYLAVGVGCGLIRLSAIAVGIIAVFPAAIGIYTAYPNGLMPALLAGLTPLLVIEGAYFATILATSRIWADKALKDAPPVQKPVSGDIPFSRKPPVRE